MIEPTEKQVLDAMPHPLHPVYRNMGKKELKEFFNTWKNIVRKQLNETPEERKQRFAAYEEFRKKLR